MTCCIPSFDFRAPSAQACIVSALSAEPERQLMKQLMKRQCGFLRHIVRKGGIECQMVTGKVVGKRDRGRQRQTFLGWLGKCLDNGGVDIIHLAENRTLRNAVTSNVRI